MTLTYTKDTNNIVTLTLSAPGRSANVISRELGEALRDAIKRLQNEETLAGVIITSAKESFLLGADIEMLIAIDSAEKAFNDGQELKAGLRALETLGKPVVAALNGTAVGGGFEIALACHYRIAIDNPGTRFGFPEVTLGLCPGAGGIVRLTRLLGLQESFPYLIEGKQLSPREAKNAGMVHELATDRADMLAKATAWILANPSAKQPWDQPKYRMPGGDPRTPKMAQILAIAPAMLKKQTYGNYPAPEAIMSAAVEGAVVDFETASRIESRYFAKLATGQVSKNMINAFWFQLNEIKAGKSRPADIPPQETHKVGVLGAGMMGHGIAYVSAMAGMDVVLKDVSQEAAEAGKAKIEKLVNQRVSRGRISAQEKEAVMNRILATANPADLQGCDLIIEAVFEDRALKAKVTAEAESQLESSAVFASNTSTLPITSLAQASMRPENFIGLHFFSPVHKMRLVEIIKGEQTNPQTLAKAFDYVLKIGKTPIVVNDGRGFYTSRVVGTYLNEGLALLSEGQHPRAIESAGLQAGLPVGPLTLADEVSLSLMQHIRRQTAKDLEAAGQKMPQHPAFTVLDKMTEQDRLGKAHGAGFYEYPQGGQKHLWPGLREIFPPQGEKLSQTEMIERLMFIQALETVRCLEEGILGSVADANIGSIFGWGFAPFQGGTLQYINAYGLEAFVKRSRELAQKYGPRFEPPALLLQKAEKGEAF